MGKQHPVIDEEPLLSVRGRRTITPAMGELGKLIRDARAKKRLSLRAAGAAAGVSFVTIRDIERGHVNRPSQDTLDGISKALDLPLADLALAAYGATPTPATT